MAKFIISAYQETYADEQIEADTLQEAITAFKAKVKNQEIVWRPSDENMEFTISEENEMGNIVMEIDNDILGVSLKA